MEIKYKLFKALVAYFFLSSSLYSDIKDWGSKKKIDIIGGQNYISNEYIKEDKSFKKIYLSYKTNMKDRLKFNYLYACINDDDRNEDSRCSFLISTSTLIIDNIFLSIGKDSLVWGRGIFFSPINYFHNVSFKNKFINKNMPIEGVELIKVQGIWEYFSFESVYTSKKKEYANRLSFFIKNISFGLSSLYNPKANFNNNIIGLDIQIPFDNYTIYVEQNHIDDTQYLLGLDKNINNIFDVFKIGAEFYKKQASKNIVLYSFIENNDFSFMYSLSKDIDYIKYKITSDMGYSFSPNFSASISSSNTFVENKDMDYVFSYNLKYQNKF